MHQLHSLLAMILKLSKYQKCVFTLNTSLCLQCTLLCDGVMHNVDEVEFFLVFYSSRTALLISAMSHSSFGTGYLMTHGINYIEITFWKHSHCEYSCCCFLEVQSTYDSSHILVNDESGTRKLY